MNKKSLIRSISIILLSGVLAAVCILYAAGLIVNAADGSIYTTEEDTPVDLEQIQQWALTDNADRERLFDDLSDARVDLADAEEDKGSGSGVSLKKSYSYDILEAELAIEEAIYAIEENETELLSESMSLYYDQQLISENMDLMAMTIAIEEENVEAIRDKYGMGLVTAIDVSEAELSLMNYEMALEQLTYSYDSVLMEINMLINQPIETSHIFVTEDIAEADFDAVLTQEMIESAVENNMDLYFLYEELELQAMEIEIYEDLNDDDDYDSTISNLEAAYTASQVEIEDKILEIKTSVYQAYNDVLSAVDALTLSQVSLKKAQLEQMMTAEAYSLGQVLDTELAAGDYDVAAAELDIVEAQIDLLEALDTYEEILGLE